MAQDAQPKPLWQRDDFFDPDGPVCLIIQATMGIAAGLDRFQPAGFPEVGHVIYPAPRQDKEGNRLADEKVCIVDSAASMANHLEQVCLAGENDPSLHPDLTGLPYVKCVTDRNPEVKDGVLSGHAADPRDRPVATSLTEGHRIASDYFLDGLKDFKWVEEAKKKETKDGKEIEVTTPAGVEGNNFREALRKEFKLIEVKKDKTYFIPADSWWSSYSTLFQYDPNSLVHGVLFAKEQIKLSRMLTAHLEAYGAARVGSSGVKFDRLGKTTSGQPIFAKDEETAREIRATFVIDLGILRSYGRDAKVEGQQSLGLNRKQKELLLALALWKVRQLLRRTFSYRSGCKLAMTDVKISTDSADVKDLPTELPKIEMKTAIGEAGVTKGVTSLYYPFDALFKPGKEEKKDAGDQEEDISDDGEESGDE
jgi:CRISPR-associated protein Csb1